MPKRLNFPETTLAGRGFRDSDRWSVGSALLTLALPHVLAGANAKAIRVAPSATNRNPQYVNPSPAPASSLAPYPGNVLDIYVDGTLIPNLDSNFPGNNHTMVVVNTPDGTQTSFSVPLFSTSHNDIVALEWDYTGNTSMLALGEYNVPPFTAGSTVNASLTMQMNAKYLGLVDFPAESSPVLMQSGVWYSLACIGGTSSQFGVFTADAEGVFVPVAGYGGTSQATLTSSPTGLTSIGQSAIAGLWTINWDVTCDPDTVTGTAPNPAYAIYNDVESVNNGNYYTGYHYGNNQGPNQGIWNLVNGYANEAFRNAFFQAQTATVSGTEALGGGG